MRFVISLVLLLLAIGTNAYAQKSKTKTKTKTITTAGPKTEKGDPEGIDPGITDNHSGVVAPPPAVYTYVEEMPKADYDYEAYITSHLHYPNEAKDAGVSGKVFIKFLVSEDGSISDVKAVRGIGAGCDEEAKRVIASMPKWKPGRQNGRAVKVYFTLPVMFKLN
jgi:periplasmic protein TonB